MFLPQAVLSVSVMEVPGARRLVRVIRPVRLGRSSGAQGLGGRGGLGRGLFGGVCLRVDAVSGWLGAGGVGGGGRRDPPVSLVVCVPNFLAFWRPAWGRGCWCPLSIYVGRACRWVWTWSGVAVLAGPPGAGGVSPRRFSLGCCVPLLRPVASGRSR